MLCEEAMAFGSLNVQRKVLPLPEGEGWGEGKMAVRCSWPVIKFHAKKMHFIETKGGPGGYEG